MSAILIVGSGGRESAFALNLARDSRLYAVIQHENPTIIDCVLQSGGEYLVDDPNNPEVVLHFAVKYQIDYVFVSADQPLANGVIDILLHHNIKAIGGTKAATRIEWDKIYSIRMMEKVCPEYTPYFQVISNHEELKTAIYQFQNRNMEIVVKPQGLTGGKGVKVMPEHLATYQDCMIYARNLLQSRSDEKVLLVEKLKGIEFTIMGITDGDTIILSPASYDYPFRYEGDVGAGTGGMGCFTSLDKKLPFMDDADLDSCQYIMQSIVNTMKKDGLFFNGVLNGGFFQTKKGIKFMEFNGRFGDPEGLSILSIMKGSLAKMLQDIWHKRLQAESIDFFRQASVIKYLVAHEYPEESKEVVCFQLDEKAIQEMGVSIFHASCVKKSDNIFQTLKKSRVTALGAVANKIEEASERINQAIEKHVVGDLEYRKDIGALESLDKLVTIEKESSQD